MTGASGILSIADNGWRGFTGTTKKLGDFTGGFINRLRDLPKAWDLGRSPLAGVQDIGPDMTWHICDEARDMVYDFVSMIPSCRSLRWTCKASYACVEEHSSDFYLQHLLFSLLIFGPGGETSREYGAPTAAVCCLGVDTRLF